MKKKKKKSQVSPSQSNGYPLFDFTVFRLMTCNIIYTGELFKFHCTAEYIKLLYYTYKPYYNSIKFF